MKYGVLPHCKVWCSIVIIYKLGAITLLWTIKPIVLVRAMVVDFEAYLQSEKCTTDSSLIFM